jgi:hypothetical protein
MFKVKYVALYIRHMHRWWWSTISWSAGTTNVISWYNTIFNIWSLFIIWTQFRHPHPQQNMFLNIICKWSELVMAKNVYLGFSSHGFTYWWIFYFCSAHCKHVPRSTLTHSTNEDLLNIKRKGDAKYRTLSRTSDITETRNSCVIKVILLACSTYIDIFKFY